MGDDIDYCAVYMKMFTDLHSRAQILNQISSEIHKTDVPPKSRWMMRIEDLQERWQRINRYPGMPDEEFESGSPELCFMPNQIQSEITGVSHIVDKLTDHYQSRRRARAFFDDHQQTE